MPQSRAARIWALHSAERCCVRMCRCGFGVLSTDSRNMRPSRPLLKGHVNATVDVLPKVCDSVVHPDAGHAELMPHRITRAQE